MRSEITKDINELVEFGLDAIDSSEKVEIPLKDLLYVFETLQEYQRFFHQPLHYETLDDVNKFLSSGGYEVLRRSIHEKLRNAFPDHIEDKFDNGDFDSPKKPYYFEVKE